MKVYKWKNYQSHPDNKSILYILDVDHDIAITVDGTVRRVSARFALSLDSLWEITEIELNPAQKIELVKVMVCKH